MNKYSGHKQKKCPKCKQMFEQQSNNHRVCLNCKAGNKLPPARPQRSEVDRILDEMEFQRTKMKGFLSE